MLLTPKSGKTFTRRSGNIYRHQKLRARKAGCGLAYSLDDLRTLLRNAVECCYCLRPLTVREVSVDHADPVSRGGCWGLPNLAVCCSSCNGAKGPLTAGEYRSLLTLMTDWPTEARRNVLARLRAGARRVAGR